MRKRNNCLVESQKNKKESFNEDKNKDELVRDPDIERKLNDFCN